MKKIFFICLSFFLCLSVAAQEPEKVDSDSIIKQLQSQLAEMQLRDVMLREKLEITGRSKRDDSIRQARHKARIDSLRKIVSGAPLIIDGDTLLKIYARKGGLYPENRVEMAREQILKYGKRLSFYADSCLIFEGEFSSDIMAGEDVILSITLDDALWENTTRQELAKRYCDIVEAKIAELHDDYGLQQKILGVVSVIVIILVQWFLIKLTLWLYRRSRIRVVRLLMRRGKPLMIKDYELLNLHKQGILFFAIGKALLFVVIFFQLLVTVPALFSAFPETKDLAFTIIGYIWNPVKTIFFAVIGFLPNLFQIIIIVICFRYLVKGIKYVMDEIANGNLKISGFYADWAQPTFVIVRVLCYSFMFVMIWPLLPSSNSEVFQGVSVFIGVIVSLGSSSIVGNIMAGMVMTYMRPFRLGDFIRYGDTEGFVVEKTILVTRIRTRKNDVITIPNSNLLTSQTTNYTVAAHDYGIVVHTKVTIGYDMKWHNIEQLLIDSAQATPGIEKHPKPFVLVTNLDDYYVEYEINAYTRDYQKLPFVYTTLRENILDNFHTAGVEIMSPHIYAHRQDLELQIPKEDQQKAEN